VLWRVLCFMAGVFVATGGNLFVMRSVMRAFVARGVMIAFSGKSRRRERGAYKARRSAQT
jgi:hypothetical protein